MKSIHGRSWLRQSCRYVVLIDGSVLQLMMIDLTSASRLRMRSSAEAQVDGFSE